MKSDPIFQKNKNFILLAIIILCFATLFYPFLNVIATSIVTAYFAYPTYRFIRKKFGDTISMILTWIAIVGVIIIPLFIIGMIGFYQAKNIVNDAKKIPNTVSQIVENPSNNKYLSMVEKYINENEETVDEIIYSVTEQIKGIGQAAAINVGNTIKGFPFFMIKLILYIFMTTSLIVGGPKIKKTLKNITPIDGNIFEIYINKIKYMTDGIMKGNFIVAGIQALTTTISFMLVGIPYAGLIFIVSFLLYIPMVGTVILYLPATIYLIVQGNYIGAILLFLWNSVAVANIDNIFRGKFVPKEAQINNTLMFISVLSGVILFGIMGVLYGPLLAVIGITTIGLYTELKRGGKQKTK